MKLESEPEVIKQFHWHFLEPNWFCSILHGGQKEGEPPGGPGIPPRLLLQAHCTSTPTQNPFTFLVSPALEGRSLTPVASVEGAIWLLAPLPILTGAFQLLLTRLVSKNWCTEVLVWCKPSWSSAQKFPHGPWQGWPTPRRTPSHGDMQGNSFLNPWKEGTWTSVLSSNGMKIISFNTGRIRLYLRAPLMTDS